MDDARRQLRKARTLDQLQRVSTRLAKLLAGQDGGLADVELPHEQRPGETLLEGLQRFKRRLNETLTRLAADDPLRCEACQRELNPEAEDEMPWANRCQSCAR